MNAEQQPRAPGEADLAGSVTIDRPREAPSTTTVFVGQAGRSIEASGTTTLPSKDFTLKAVYAKIYKENPSEPERPPKDVVTGEVSVQKWRYTRSDPIPGAQCGNIQCSSDNYLVVWAEFVDRGERKEYRRDKVRFCGLCA